MNQKTKFIAKLSDYGFSKESNNFNYAAFTHLGTPATMVPEFMMMINLIMKNLTYGMWES